MRCMTLISGWILISVALCGGVGAAVEKHRATPVAAVPNDIRSLQSAETYPLARGRVVAVDSKDGKITVAHAPIPHLYLERTTRIFPVEDRAMLMGHTPGDKIRFDLKRLDGHYIITRIENSN